MVRNTYVINVDQRETPLLTPGLSIAFEKAGPPPSHHRVNARNDVQRRALGEMMRQAAQAAIPAAESGFDEFDGEEIG
jgi:hypothetical protein